MVFFELYTVKPPLKNIFYTTSSWVIVIIVYNTNGCTVDTLPDCSLFVVANCSYLQMNISEATQIQPKST